MSERHSVACGDFFQFMRPEHEWTVDGFASAEAAVLWSQRFVRRSVEALRKPGQTTEQLTREYWGWGDWAACPGFDLRPWVEWCVANPAITPDDTNCESVEPPCR